MVAVPSWSFHFWPWHLADFKKAGQGNSNTFSISLFSLSKFVDPDPDILASILLGFPDGQFWQVGLRIRGLVPSDVSKGPIIK